MSMIIDGTNGLTFNNATTQNSGGKVLQVIEGSTSTQTSNSSASVYADTGLTASITPLFATSKILVMFSQQATSARTATNGEMNLDLQLLRGATVLVEYADYSQVANTASLASIGTVISLTYLDSPATTSATTYKLQGRPDSTANSQVAYFQQSGRVRSSIILMEIAV